jgi:hypothetical protein
MLYHAKLQIKFEFGCGPFRFHEVMALGLRKLSGIISFPHFFLSAFRYSFNIWYIALICHTKLQIKFEFGFGPLSFHEVMALGHRKMSGFITFPHFPPICSQIFT